MKEKEKNIMKIIKIELSMKEILKMVNMKEKGKYMIIMEISNLKAILEMENAREKYMMKEVIFYLKEIL